MQIDRAGGELLTHPDQIAGFHSQLHIGRHAVLLCVLFGATHRNNGDNFFVFFLSNFHFTSHFADHSLGFRITYFKQLFHPRQALGHVKTNDTTRVFGSHGQLSTWFTDRLSGNDAHRHTNFNIGSGREIPAITFGTHALGRLTSQR